VVEMVVEMVVWVTARIMMNTVEESKNDSILCHRKYKNRTPE
jgi:hypothetical protein